MIRPILVNTNPEPAVALPSRLVYTKSPLNTIPLPNPLEGIRSIMAADGKVEVDTSGSVLINTPALGYLNVNGATVTSNQVHFTVRQRIDNTVLASTPNIQDLGQRITISLVDRLNRTIFDTANAQTGFAANITQNTTAARTIDDWGTAIDLAGVNVVNYAVVPGINYLTVDMVVNVDPEIAAQGLANQFHFDRQAHLINTIRDKMRRSTFIVRKGRTHIPKESAASAQERKARETLRELLPESEWRRYITNGFIMIKAPSGLWYQIFNPKAQTAFKSVKTYKNGRPHEWLCIHTDNECPPTDHVLNMKILIEIDEAAVRKGSCITSANKPEYVAFGQMVDGTVADVKAADKRETLVDVYRRLKPKQESAA